MNTKNPFRHSKTIRYFFLVLGVAGALVVTTASRAESTHSPLSAESTACSNLDVIFLVDQSNSMQGNDPTDQREYAVEGLIDLLVDLALDQCPGSFHRIGVISFGTNVSVVLPFSNIAPVDLNERQQLREQLKQNIEADSMGATNTWDAFREADRMFDNVGSAPASDVPRKRVIILITDGFPGVGWIPGQGSYLDNSRALKQLVNSLFGFDNSLLQQELCLKALREEYSGRDIPIPDEEISRCLGDYRPGEEAYENSTYIFTILLRSFETPSRYVLEVFEDMTSEYAGELITLSENRADIPSTMREILSQLAGVRPNVLECGNVAVNPYLRQARVIVYGIDEINRITLSYTDVNRTSYSIHKPEVDVAGRPLHPEQISGFTVNEYYTFGTNERYEFNYPYPGIWQLQADYCEGLDVYYETVEINPQGYQPIAEQVPQYDLAPYYDTEAPFYLRYQMRDANGAIVPQADSAIFHIDLLMAVTDPNGNRIVYPMEWKEAELLFQSKDPVQVPVPGVYKIEIEGKTLKHEGEPVVETNIPSREFTTVYTLFEHEGVEFTVYPVTGFVIASVTPQDGQTLGPIHETILGGWPLKVRPFPVRVRITDRHGQILTNITDIFTDTGQAFTVTLIAGSQSSTPITLRPDPNVPGEFIGDIVGFEAEGPQTLIIQSQAASITQTYSLDDRLVEVEFTRLDCLFCRANTYYALLGMTVFAALAMIGYNIAIRTNKVSGNLAFKDGTTTIAEFGLHNGTNFRKIGPRELKSYPQLMLKRLKVQNAGKKKRAKQETGDEVTGFLTDEQPSGVLVHCVLTSGRRSTVPLEPQLPTTYSEETFAQMVYEPVE